MKLWRISQDNNSYYDTFDEAVVAAETEEEAREMHPEELWNSRNPCPKPVEEYRAKACKSNFPTWAESPDLVTVRYLGEAREDQESGVIVASFNAG